MLHIFQQIFLSNFHKAHAYGVVKQAMTLDCCESEHWHAGVVDVSDSDQQTAQPRVQHEKHNHIKFQHTEILSLDHAEHAWGASMQSHQSDHPCHQFT